MPALPRAACADVRDHRLGNFSIADQLCRIPLQRLAKPISPRSRSRHRGGIRFQTSAASECRLRAKSHRNMRDGDARRRSQNGGESGGDRSMGDISASGARQGPGEPLPRAFRATRSRNHATRTQYSRRRIKETNIAPLTFAAADIFNVRPTPVRSWFTIPASIAEIARLSPRLKRGSKSTRRISFVVRCCLTSLRHHSVEHRHAKHRCHCPTLARASPATTLVPYRASGACAPFATSALRSCQILPFSVVSEEFEWMQQTSPHNHAYGRPGKEETRAANHADSIVPRIRWHQDRPTARPAD